MEIFSKNTAPKVSVQQDMTAVEAEFLKKKEDKKRKKLCLFTSRSLIQDLFFCCVTFLPGDKSDKSELNGGIYSEMHMFAVDCGSFQAALKQ